MFLCPYCKGDDFYIFQHAYSGNNQFNTVAQIVCVKCRWVKKNVDLSVPWGPYHPSVKICEGENVYKNTNQDMTIIPTPPEETLPACELPEAPKGVYVPITAEVTQDCIKPIKKVKATHGAAPMKPAEKPIVGTKQTITIYSDHNDEVTDKRLVIPQLFKWAKNINHYFKPDGKNPNPNKKFQKKPPPIQEAGDGSRWDEI
jgi:hypothetical protein